MGVQQGLAAGDDDVCPSQPVPHVGKHALPVFERGQPFFASAPLPDVAMHAVSGAAHGEHDDDRSRPAMHGPAAAVERPQPPVNRVANAPCEICEHIVPFPLIIQQLSIQC